MMNHACHTCVNPEQHCFPGCFPGSCVPMLQASAAPQAAAPPAGGEQKKLWGGRFTGKTDPLMEKFNESLPFDKRMWAEDIRVSMQRCLCCHCCLCLCEPGRVPAPSGGEPLEGFASPCLLCKNTAAD